MESAVTRGYVSMLPGISCLEVQGRGLRSGMLQMEHLPGCPFLLMPWHCLQ